MLAKLEYSFARDLHIAQGRLYAEMYDRLVLKNDPSRHEASRFDKTAVLDDETVQLVISNGSYIYNDPLLNIKWREEPGNDTAAFE